MTAFTGSLPGVKTGATQFNNGQWNFPEQMGKAKPGEKDYVGFIYCIYDAYLNRGYIGKKSFLSNGTLNKGKETDWRRYRSSSSLLKEVMDARPKEEFEFICLEQYTTKGTLSYSETWSLCLVEAPTSTRFYNTRIEPVSWVVKEPISDRHKHRLNDILRRMDNAQRI